MLLVKLKNYLLINLSKSIPSVPDVTGDVVPTGPSNPLPTLPKF